MKITTWNVNGVRARESQVSDWLRLEKPDVLCLQEIKASPHQVPVSIAEPEGYWADWHGEGGYSGVALLISKTLCPVQPVFSSPQLVKDYVQIQLGHLPHEVFAVLFLDAQHRLIACEELFRGTLTQTSVYPREVVKRALAHNAASLILAHNHPSGLLEPSRADELLTQTLKSSLNLVDVRVLDHLVVGRTGALSFAERGLI